MRKFFKDFLRTVFGMPENEPVSDVGIYIVLGILLAIFIVTLNL